jgi:hypothetical protein
MFRTDAVIPADPDGLDVLHDREYRVRAYRLADDRLLIRGAVRDQKPPGLFFDDDEPLTMHHMQVELEVAFPSLEIVDANVVFDTHPHSTCPAIVEHYRSLVGLSIARGFTHRVRELFGGPRGCTHTTALLLAMAPVAVQSLWSMRAAARPASNGPGDAARAQALQANVDTCHVWADDGEQVADLRAGRPVEIPLTLQRRLRELGRSADDWPGA